MTTRRRGRRRIRRQAGCALAASGTRRRAAAAASAHGWLSAGSWTSSEAVSPDQQKGAYPNCDSDEDGSFAERVEAAKIDQDDVDDVAPVGQARRRIGVVIGHS